MPDQPPTSLFADAIDVPLWLEHDRETPYAERLRRDRELARRLESQEPRGPGQRGAVERVRTWWREAGRDEAAGPGRKLEAVRRLVTAGMALLGIVSGTGLALGAFHYNGTEPVNVVKVLALLVGIQSLLLILTLLLLPGRIPGLRGLQDAVAAINPGALAASLYRRIARPQAEIATLFGWHPGRATAASHFAKWQLLRWAQVAAVAFNCAALATAAVLITFTDLAFGWSTTLPASPETVAHIVHTAAWPWHALIPSAVPDLELIARSQFFRLEGSAAFNAAASRELTGWWSFTVLTIMIYGLVPRVLLLVFAGLRLNAAECGLLLDDSRVAALLERMASPEIETTLPETEPVETERTPRPVTERPRIAGAAIGIIWSRALPAGDAAAYARARLGLDLATLIEAGGALDLAEDQAALESARKAGQSTAVIFTPAWEPPLLEFLDFVAALRRALGPASSVLVTPIAEDERCVNAVETDIWGRALGRLADPQVFLEVGA
ncbi:MAG TPA: DUF2868 domain-containing protein [Gammaproteobacteria bacterium]|nr:DUF2868 domain-containing protein [Gammaproteobacteria bacterium]